MEFISSSALLPLVGGDGGLVYESVGKADRLLDNFDSKQSRESVDLLLTCHHLSVLSPLPIRSSDVSHLLVDFDPYGGSDPLGMVHLFLKRPADALATHLLCLGSFLAC